MDRSTGYRLTDFDMVTHDISQAVHVLLDEDIRSFFETDPDDWTDLDWGADGIARVMHWFHVTGDIQHQPVLIVGAPELSIEDVFTDQFMFAWNRWMSQERQRGSILNYTVIAHGDNDSDAELIRPHRPGERLIEVRIFTKEYFGSKMEPWRSILEELNLNLAFDRWRTGRSVTLREHFGNGEAHCSNPDDPDSLAMVSILTGPNHSIEVGMPYYIPGSPITR